MAKEVENSSPDRPAFLGTAASLGAAALLGGFGISPATVAIIQRP
jgi:hypothetical protein